MNGSCYFYAVISTDGCHCYRDPIAALQHAEFMSSVGSESVFYLAYQPEGGEVELLERMTYQDLKVFGKRVIDIAVRYARGEAGSHEQQPPRSQRE